ncbi:hypothetical protein QAD02_010147 [Eretmocerus hayati]|uniref:Uncharacterized protein n=1 Tax=Eretmocerus hayati TaxID=131215 RepID=A0ACC2NB98_9HYME|nr:hypothetical protein QAD02_010147 [Eretmocerus hayati]
MDVRDSAANHVIHDAVIQQDESLVNKLVTSGVNVNVCDWRDRPPIYKAVAQENYNICHLLLEGGANVNFKTSDNGTSPSVMQMVIEARNCSILQLLLTRGLDPNTKCRNRSALLFAATQKYSGSYPQILKMLVTWGARIDAESFEAVIERGTLEIIQLFVAHGVKQTIFRDQLLLHRSLKNPRDNVFKYILSTDRFHPEMRNDKGRTALHTAAENRRPAAMQLLIDRGVEINPIDKGGLTPLHLLALRSRRSVGSSLKCHEMLLRHGANPDIKSRLGGRTPRDISESLIKLDQLKYRKSI